MLTIVCFYLGENLFSPKTKSAVSKTKRKVLEIFGLYSSVYIANVQIGCVTIREHFLGKVLLYGNTFCFAI